MAITYNIAKCKKGWGVYVRAISGDELKTLVPTIDRSVVRVTSGRLARKRSQQSAKFLISRIAKESSEEQINRLRNVWIKIAPRDYKVIRVQNLKVIRETDSGSLIPQLTTTNKTYAEKVALFYSLERNKKSFLRKTTTKYIKVPYNTDTSNLNEI